MVAIRRCICPSDKLGTPDPALVLPPPPPAVFGAEPEGVLGDDVMLACDSSCDEFGCCCCWCWCVDGLEGGGCRESESARLGVDAAKGLWGKAECVAVESVAGWGPR